MRILPSNLTEKAFRDAIDGIMRNDEEQTVTVLLRKDYPDTRDLRPYRAEGKVKGKLTEQNYEIDHIEVGDVSIPIAAIEEIQVGEKRALHHPTKGSRVRAHSIAF